MCGLGSVRFLCVSFKDTVLLVDADMRAGSPKALRGDVTILFVPLRGESDACEHEPVYNIFLYGLVSTGFSTESCGVVLCCALLFRLSLSATRLNRWISSVSLSLCSVH